MRSWLGADGAQAGVGRHTQGGWVQIRTLFSRRCSRVVSLQEIIMSIIHRPRHLDPDWLAKVCVEIPRRAGQG